MEDRPAPEESSAPSDENSAPIAETTAPVAKLEAVPRPRIEGLLLSLHGTVALVTWSVCVAHVPAPRYVLAAIAGAGHVVAGVLIFLRRDRLRRWVLRYVLFVLVMALGVGALVRPSEVTALNMVWGFCILSMILAEPSKFRVAVSALGLYAFDAMFVLGALKRLRGAP